MTENVTENMTETMTRTTTETMHPRDRAAAASYRRRLRAAGIDENKEPADIVEFRLTFARQLYMLVNHWHGCPELLCRRNRGCMAPHIICSNIEQLPQEEFDRQWFAVKDNISLAIKAYLAEHGTDDMEDM